VGLGNLSSGSPLLAIIGFIIIGLYVLKYPAQCFIGILAATVISIPLGVTLVPQGWSPIDIPEASLLFRSDFSSVLSFQFYMVFFTFRFVDIFDTVGTLVGDYPGGAY
jgi:AGZA family xanthine/uracil permease-like MFS transporter